MDALRTLIFAALAAISCGTAAAQTFPVDPQPSSVVKGSVSAAASQEELMARLRRWVALTFDRSDVIDMADDKRGTMVLKWSAPLPQSSKWLNAVLTETCVIDIRPNGRYRLQVFSPRISFGFTEAASLFDEMGLANPEAEADMRLVNGLAQRMYGGSLEWPVDEQLDQIVAAYLEQLNSTQQFRNERDRERGRATDEYRTAEHQWRILHDVRNGAESYNTSLVQSLSRALNTSDDF